MKKRTTTKRRSTKTSKARTKKRTARPRKASPRRKTAKKTARKGHRPVSVLEHFYKRTERKQAALKKLIKRRGGSV